MMVVVGVLVVGTLAHVCVIKHVRLGDPTIQVCLISAALFPIL